MAAVALAQWDLMDAERKLDDARAALADV